MITELDVPDMNIIKRFNETKLEALYDLVKEEYIKKIKNLIIGYLFLMM